MTPRARWMFLAILAGCGQGDSAVLVNVAPVPTRTVQMVVDFSLDDKPAMMPLQLMPNNVEFGVDLPRTTSGQLTLTASALDSDGCTQGSSTGSVQLPSGRTDLQMPLQAASPRKCGALPGCAANMVCAPAKVSSQDIKSIWPISPTDIWAVGLNATLMHFDGVLWTIVSPPAGVTAGVFGVWAAASNNVWAVGDFGIILHYDGIAWSSVASPTALKLNGIWGVAPNNIWAVGAASLSTNPGAFLHFDGTAWNSINDPNLMTMMGDYQSVWAGDPNFVYACGLSGLLVRFNGLSWNKILSYTTVNLYSVWGTPGGMTSGNVFATGDSGVILHIDYTSSTPTWTPYASTGTLSKLYGIHGDGMNAVYAVGGGSVVRADGPSYSSFAPTNSGAPGLFAVHSLSNGLTWLGGQGGFLGYVDLRP